jgi:hypothetical protein
MPTKILTSPTVASSLEDVASRAPAVPDTAGPATDALASAQRTVAFFERHAVDPHAAARLCRAATSVHIHLGEGVGATVRLDCEPLEAEVGIVGAAEIEIHCSPAQLDAHIRGERTLAQEIMRREVSYVGPVRKFLSIAPILRGLSRDHAEA